MAAVLHDSVMAFVAQAVADHDLADKSVLEVGSRDFNGTPRALFTGRYHGTDMQDGPCVDEVINAHDLAYQAEWDVIVCTEVLEHDTLPWISLAKMRQAIKPGGILILTARGYDERGCFGVHGYPDDHWRYSVSGMTALLSATGWEPIQVIADPQDPGVLSTARPIKYEQCRCCDNPCGPVYRHADGP